jgi:hypothetical protein
MSESFPPLVQEAAAFDADFLISEANLYRSRETITVPQGAAILRPGTLLTLAGASATAANADGLLMFAVDPRRGPVRGVLVARDAEVRDANILYGALDRAAVNARLATRNILVRAAVLVDSIVTPSNAPVDRPSNAERTSASGVPAEMGASVFTVGEPQPSPAELAGGAGGSVAATTGGTPLADGQPERSPPATGDH